ncbi:MAG: DUF58 domain-containing protein, partial [Myxococcota bacterium]
TLVVFKNAPTAHLLYNRFFEASMRPTPFLDPSLLNKLPPNAIKAFHVVEGVLTGLHRSPHHGQSIEFTEHKEYAPGDEIRNIDWKLFAKSDRYYVKQFEDETNLSAYVLFDASASMAYPHHPAALQQRPSKYGLGASLVLALAYLLLKQRDAVALHVGHQQQNRYFPPQSKPSYLLPLAHALEEQNPHGTWPLDAALKNVMQHAKKRGLVIVLSDFFSDLDPLQKRLRQVMHRGHDIVLFHLLDRDEVDFPFHEHTLFEDLEAQHPSLQVDAQSIKPYYEEEMQRFLEQVDALAISCGAYLQRILTDEPLNQALRRFLIKRLKKRTR